MVSGLNIIKSFTNFEFILLNGVSWWSNIIFLHVPVQFSQHHLLKRLFLLYCMFLPPLTNINWSQINGFNPWALHSVSLTYASVPMPVLDCFGYSGLFAIRYCDPSYFVTFSRLLRLFGVLWFHINFWSICSRSVKYAMVFYFIYLFNLF